jgi:hypothetical protein
MITTESQLAAKCDDYAEFYLIEWVADDRRLLTVYFNISEADHDDDLPSVTIIGAVAADGALSEVFTRDTLIGMIGKDAVVWMEETKAEESA